MKNLIEISGEKIKGDQYVNGSFVKDGTDIHIKSIANFEGFECRIWSPEFHGVMLDSAIFHAVEADVVRKKLEYVVGAIDGVKELAETESNTENSFRAIQHAMNCIVMSIACLEAWSNRIIHSELKGSLKFERTNKKGTVVVEWESSRIEKDSDLLEKLFIIIPILFGIKPVERSATVRSRIKEITADRNALIHMKGKPQFNGQIETRRNLALKLLRRNPLLIVKNVISAIKMLYEKSDREIPIWLTENISSLIVAEKRSRKI
uniref:hypothetical protein n=1 Tax=Cellvibrio fontiphilus TaxID=1815559 RepID=UPI002B4BD7C8|nr:hypothetical protein [Cellvibrio fontiphilus]